MNNSKLIREAVADSLVPIRPGSVKGQPFWNTYATHFIYAPSFEFKKIRGAALYRFFVEDRFGTVRKFDAETPFAALSPVWAKLPAGRVAVTVEAFDKKGRSLGSAGKRTLYRCAVFTNSYPPKTRSYAESARMAYEYLFNLKNIQYLKCGKPDPDYWLYCYPSKMFAAIINGMINYAEMVPGKRADALDIAVKSADYLIKTAVPKGKDLQFFPQTYEGAKLTAAKNNGTIMLLYPASVGGAMLRLAEAVRKKKYLDYAKKIGDTYLRLQQPDGSWRLIYEIESGKPVVSNRCDPVGIIGFLTSLSDACGCACYTEAAEKAASFFAPIIKSFDWEGQFEDVEAQSKPYLNLSHTVPTGIMQCLVKRYPNDKKIIAQAREVQRFAEDQFIVWEQPGWVWTENCFCNRLEQNDSWGWYRWHVPAVLEQYRCYTPVDGSSANMIRYFLMMYDLEKNPMDLAKARALADSITRVQAENGRIPTWVDPKSGEGSDWINCMFGTANAMKLIAEYDAVEL